MSDEHVGLRYDLRNRLEITQCVIRQLAVEAVANDKRRRCEHDGVPVRHCFSCDFRTHRADAIVDNDLLAPSFRQLRRDEARDDIGAAPCL